MVFGTKFIEMSFIFNGNTHPCVCVYRDRCAEISELNIKKRMKKIDGDARKKGIH